MIIWIDEKMSNKLDVCDEETNETIREDKLNVNFNELNDSVMETMMLCLQSTGNNCETDEVDFDKRKYDLIKG